ncbi:LANO_0C02344g1_1 [Lachancea nothofagi CBS 11611]|uniref:LANO_0C02344g1_1 n=1 Tax=Lachancea nothofagi CBS 11611 TaxID=1266666 RepID=A0A1G4J502_9SACH|nr:LANO_0C02344g1_1 [Lachancea nothofagi CBS 11611]
MGVDSLGLGHDNDMMEPQLSFEGPNKPIKICGGGNFTALLQEDGSLYLAGDVPLERSSSDDNWIQVRGLFKDVSCGWSHVVAITSEDIVVSGGVGEKGELGQLDTRHSLSLQPIWTLQNPREAQVFACFYNTYVLDDGKLYGCGSNSKSQLKESKSRAICSLTIVSAGPVSHACVGKNFVCFVEKGQARVMGTMAQYEAELRNIMSENTNFEFNSMWTSIVVLLHQKFYFYGQASQKQDVVAVHSFNEPATAWSTGSEHGMVCIDKREVYCWGWGEHGNCGSIATSRAINGVNDKSNVNSEVNSVYKVTASDSIVYACFGGCATSWICTATSESETCK